MPILLRYSETLNLSFVECAGAVSTAELGALAACAAKDSALLESDSLNVIRPDADFSAVDIPALSALYARFQTLYAPIKLEVYRRTAWVCQNPSAQAHVDLFAGSRDAGKTFSTNARRMETLSEAGEWLMLSDVELAQVESGEGFTQIARFNEPAAPAMAP